VPVGEGRLVIERGLLLEGRLTERWLLRGGRGCCGGRRHRGRIGGRACRPALLDHPGTSVR
jgi:hypothetical protein